MLCGMADHQTWTGFPAGHKKRWQNGSYPRLEVDSASPQKCKKNVLSLAENRTRGGRELGSEVDSRMTSANVTITPRKMMDVWLEYCRYDHKYPLRPKTVSEYVHCTRTRHWASSPTVSIRSTRISISGKMRYQTTHHRIST